MSEKTVSTSEQTHAETGGRTPPPLPALQGFEPLSLLGNQATTRLLRGSLGIVQPKLRIGPAGDVYEREADRVADTILSGPAAPAAISTVAGTVQRACGCPGGECHCQDEEEELVQPKEAPGGTAPSTPSFEARVNALQGGGAPLPTSARSFFEPRFGHDFSAVRVHTGTAARDAARTIHARAFTVGNDVVFGAGEYSPETPSGRHLLAHELTHVVQQTPLVARRAPIVQREAEELAPVSEEPAIESAPESEPVPGESLPEDSAAPEGSPAAPLLVEDGTQEVGPDQMTKSDFLSRLRPEVCAAADEGLAGTEHSAQGCPFIDFWFPYYEAQSAERINRDLTRFAGEGPRPTTAEGYISLIVERVRQSVAVWASTGEITGVPEGIPLPGMNLPGVGAAATTLGGVLFKARPGGARDPGDPRVIRDQLGAGQPLDGTVRSRMESAFGRSFSHVRVHTDGGAAGVSERLNAKAFAVGEHVAFGAGEYRPGSIVGDALIAHELAHVAQQGGGSEARSEALEQDADRSALSAVASIWGGAKGRLGTPDAAPRLGSGLRLSRCKSDSATACPTFKSLEAKKTGKIVMTTAWRTICEKAFGEPGSPGITIESKVEVPSGCTGTLEYVQLIDSCTQWTQADGTNQRIKSSGFVLDTSDPYKSKAVTSSGTVTFTTDDSPGTPTGTRKFLAVDDKFKMWLLWRPDKPAGSPRVALAMAEWFWKAKATKTGSSGGCAADWTLSDTAADGSVGKATTTLPTWTKNYTELKPEAGTC
jgi:hypothetical protein